MSKSDVHRGSADKSKFLGKDFSPSERHNSLNPVIKNPLNTEITEKRDSQYLEQRNNNSFTTPSSKMEPFRGH